MVDKSKEVLAKHRRFIAELNDKKKKERGKKCVEEDEMKKRDQNIKEKAAAHRIKIKKWREEMQAINKVFGGDEEKVNDNAEKPVKLTAENLSKHDKTEEKKIKPIEPEPKPEQDIAPEAKSTVSEKSEVKKTPERASTKHERKKPAWALTEKQAEELKEQEVDNLLEFAYQLDYEKFIEDFEVRQALSVLKERVQELKKDDKWKENFAEKWNQEAAANPPPENPVAEEKVEVQSVKSVGPKSIRSQARSIKSMADTVKELNEKQKNEKPEWDKSVKGSEKITVEEKAAIQIADQIMQNAPHLKGVHSKTSIRKILEREAKAQLMAKEEPRIVTVKEHERCGSMDPSNLPYLHRNEAV